MKNVNEITEELTIISTGNELINQFLGNDGAVRGGLYFVYGEAGSSKSTFLQWLMKTVSLTPTNIAAYFSNEQSEIAIKDNLKRLNIAGEFFLQTGHDISEFKKGCLELLEKNPDKQLWCVVDALQGMTDLNDYPRKFELDVHVVVSLREFAVKHGLIIFLIGHSNKKGQYTGTTKINHNCDVEINIANDSPTIRSVYVKKNRFGGSGSSIRLNLADGKFEIMPAKNIMELDFSKKEDQALMPRAMRLLKENSFAGKIAQETMRQGTGAIKKAVVSGIKGLFKKGKRK